MRPSRDVLETLFEGAPRFVDRLAGLDVEGWDELLDRADEIAVRMPEDEQVELLNAHPRIGASPATVSAVSYREQGYDRDPGTPELEARLDELNARYEARNGFRFVVFVDGRPRSVIADYMAARLEADRDDEKRRALADVIAIARSRHAELASPKESG